MQWWRPKRPRRINWGPPDPASVAIRAKLRAARPDGPQPSNRLMQIGMSLKESGFGMTDSSTLVIKNRDVAVAWFKQALAEFDATQSGRPEMEAHRRPLGGDADSEAVAWQRKLRERRMIEEPRAPSSSLDGYSVESIGRMEASAIIGKYEWLGTVGRADHTVGLLSPSRELEGAACFGYGPQGPIRTIIGEPALCLERGACVHFAPPNAASFLIMRACKLIYRLTGVARFFAYGDPMAGEYGAVYQAAGWAYLGQGLYGGKERASRHAVLPPDKDPDDPSNWQTTRALRRHTPRLTLPIAVAAGWRISKRDAKHVYAVNVGRDRKHWLKGLVTRSYPAPRPHLKIKVSARILAVTSA